MQPLAVPIDTWDLFTPADDRVRFDACRACDQPIEEESPQYVIERQFQRPDPGAPAEVVYEFALCESCLADQDASYSPSSQQHIAQFYSDVIDLNVRGDQLLAEAEDGEIPDIRRWVDACAVTGTPTAETDRYRLMAYAFGEWLLVAGTPVVMSEAALNRLDEGISQDTRERARNFAVNQMNLPPEAFNVTPGI